MTLATDCYINKVMALTGKVWETADGGVSLHEEVHSEQAPCAW